MVPMETHYCIIPSPVGDLIAVEQSDLITGLYFGAHNDVPEPGWVECEGVEVFDRLRSQLSEYFAGELQDFDLPLDPHGTEFQKSVWSALRQIPYGETVSYSDIATAIGNARAVRAVGGANGRNPIPIVIPCHRVVAADGGLGGFSSGLHNKEWLLNHEGAKSFTLQPS
jgi:methylated-DNA-[protein]-cysteine S-methyltransferase